MGSTFSNMVFTTLLTCLLMMHLNAAPVCNYNKLKYNEFGHGLCGSNGSVMIWKCPTCAPGLGLSDECGRRYPKETKVDCVECIANHTYSDTYDISQCKQCTRCQENEVQSGQCTRENDTIRCTCKPGYYRERGHCKPCSRCCGDKTNEKVPECNIPQVPMGKQCSLQTAKNCAPTTRAPSTISITTYSGGKDSGESIFSQNSAWIITGTIIVVMVIIFLALLARYCCCNERSSNSSNGDSGENSGSTSNASSSGNSSNGDSGENSGSTSNESSSATLLSEDKSVGDVNSNKPVEAHVDLKETSTAEFHAGPKHAMK